MNWLRRLLNVFRSERVSSDIAREMSFHVAERADALAAQGMPAHEAEREARRRFGNDVALRERSREQKLLSWVETLVSDVRYGVRSLRATPVFSLVAIVSLALGIGANTAIFSLMNALMLRTLPVHAPEELVQVNLGSAQASALTNPMWEALRDRQDVFGGLFAYAPTRFNLAERGEERPVPGSYVSGAYFGTLGVRPAAGRMLAPADDVRGCAGAAVLSHGLWQREFGGAPDVTSRTILLSGRRIPIVGVADESFFGVVVGSSVQVYLPLCAEAVIAGAGTGLDQRSRWWLTVVGRPAQGLTKERIEARLATLAPGVMEATVPEHYNASSRDLYLANTFSTAPAATGLSSLREAYSRALLMLMVIVGVVLLVACANVANLLLARATARQREIAVRLAIGAGRGRVLRQLLTESLLLALIGAGLGVLLARWGSSLLVSFISTSTSQVYLDLSPDLRVLLFTTLVAAATGVLFGLAPAWRSARVNPHTVMKAHTRSVVEGHSRFNAGKALVAAQIALSLVLVTGAALLVGSFRQLSTYDAGFTRTGVLLATVDMGSGAAEAPPTDWRELLERARALPRVENAAVASIIPLSGSSWNDFIVVDGFTPGGDEEALSWMNEVSEGYFDTFGTALVAGRDFTPDDRAGAPDVAIVNEAFARHYFGAVAVVGRQFRTQFIDDLSEPYEIVGVVRDAKYRSLREETERLAYLPIGQGRGPGQRISLALRTDGDPEALIPAFTDMAEGFVPRASLRFGTFEDQLAQSITRERLLATLSGFFGALALLLAMIGLYGIMSYSVARRRAEIGIRLAMGSARSGVLRLVLGEVGWLVIAGLAAGTAAVLAAMRFMNSFLYGISGTEPGLLMMSAVILAAVALVAGGLPAWRASRLEPMEALRVD
ncbi:MAG TPA: ABC transporter permease [Longimicrobiales bacterium]|nr:ABC transporter permease [Longimicrobiales bacterium]